MEKTISADGTVISYDATGSGRPVVLIPAAFNLRGAFDDLATTLAAEYAVYSYDRRGRGDSTDAIPASEVEHFEIDREIEDLDAVIAAAGGSASVFGFSSGAMLALQAAVAGSAIDKIVLYEPPFREQQAKRPELQQRLTELIRSGKSDEAVATFQIDGIGLPAPMVDQMRQSPIWPALTAIAQTTVYDAALTADLTPSQAVRELDQPILVLAGSETWPQLIDGARYAADMINSARYQQVDGGAGHSIPAATTAKAVRDFLG
jgi:pimeloyl-ACP methyl ester carboxylesterase